MFGFGGGGRCGPGPGGGPGRGPGGGGPRFGRFMRGFGGGWGGMLSDLDLTDDQLERLAELKIEGLGHWSQLKVALGQLMRQIVRELSNEQIDKAKIKDLGKQMQNAKNQAGDQFLDRVIAFAEVLTPEQRKKMRMKAIKRFLGVGDHDHDHHD